MPLKMHIQMIQPALATLKSLWLLRHMPAAVVKNSLQAYHSNVPSENTVRGLIPLLRKCRKDKNLASAKTVYADIQKNGMESHGAIGNHLVPTLVDCGALDEARQVFDRLPHRNERAWTSLMSGYNNRSESHRALILYSKMQEDCVPPSSFTLVVALKACAGLKDWVKGQEIHAEITHMGCEGDPFVGNALVDMYAKCGSIVDALEASKKLSVRDVVTWTAIITGYVEHGRFQESVTCSEVMQEGGISPNAVTFVCILRAVAGTGLIGKGREVHTSVVLFGFEGDLIVGNTLIHMYGKCGCLSSAQEVFNKLPYQDGVSWNALIAGYADHEPGKDVLKAYERMQVAGVSPDAVTFVCALKACSNLGALGKGQEIHADITRKGFEEYLVGNAVVDMYAKCDMMLDAHEALGKLPFRDAASWNALIIGYAEKALGEQAFSCFEQMQEEGVAPDSITYVSTLKACNGTKGCIDKGKFLHKGVILLGFEQNTIVGSALVDMYAKNGLLVDAQAIFDHIAVRHVMVWTALIAGYAEYGPCKAALKCYERMLVEGVPPDPGMFVCLLKACIKAGAFFYAHQLHTDIAKRGFEQDLLIGSILVDVYAKFGSLLEAQKVFEILPIRDAVSWSAMIRGYGVNHEGSRAVKCFQSMQDEGVQMDDITFTCLLHACSRTQQIVKGQEFFDLMGGKHGFMPTLEQYTCIVDLLAKSGHLHEAEKYLEGMPYPPLLTALLTACKFHGEANLGQKCFQQLTQLDSVCT